MRSTHAAALISVLCIPALGNLRALAADREIQGRTGLPSVRFGVNRIWLERGNVVLRAADGNLLADQRFRIHYPGPPVESKRLVSTIGVREDYYRSVEDGSRKVTPAEASGFNRFAVWVDGRRVHSTVSAWKLNDKQDTATRWREWIVTFRPGQVHTMRIVSDARLGWYDGNRWVAFVTKDLGHWRQPPDYLDIRLTAPGDVETHLVQYEPKPTTVAPGGLYWTYRKEDPDRDVFVILPTRFAHRASR